MSSSNKQNNLKATLILDAKAILAEGSLWHPQEQKLYWVDIEGKELHLYDPHTNQDKKFSTGTRVGTVVPVQGGGALVALQNGIHKIDTSTGKLTLLHNPLPEGIRFNDGKCDPSGRFWVGTMALDQEEGAAVLYRLGTDQQLEQMLDNLTISNGIIWSPNAKTMYLADTPTGKIFAFDFDNESGEISNKRTAIQIPEAAGKPDGITIDTEGKLWVALFGGGAVARWDPESGEMLQKIEVDAPNTTSCAFGGENLDVLYITSGRDGLDGEKLEKHPHSGGIFSVKPGVKGVAADFYKGKV